MLKACLVLLSQVFATEAGCCKVIGFLPRDLAQYLSPLMDKYCLSFEVFFLFPFSLGWIFPISSGWNQGPIAYGARLSPYARYFEKMTSIN